MHPHVSRIIVVAVAAALAVQPMAAQRERTRPRPRSSTSVSQSQASELTLTVTEAAVRLLLVWVRTAGTIDDDKRTITATLSADEAVHVKAGQRVRAFLPRSVSRMNQGTVVSASRQGPNVVVVKVALAGPAVEPGRHYVVEIVTEQGELLSVPNEAILESGGKHVVYVQEADGSYTPRDITVGVRGELFAEVSDGLKPGEQVVTIGSFFIDAEHRLKAF
jgi:hypothetical protein